MILVFGSTGQLARELRLLDTDLHLLSREDVDLAHPNDCAQAIEEKRPEAVINAAAFTAVDTAEEHAELAMRINCAAPAAMASACAELGIPFVTISTDYVFDGSGTAPWRTDAAIAPINAYGHSKAAGEAAVREAGGIHAIVRTSWVFSAHGRNFLSTMLSLGKQKDRLTIVADQIGGPTPTSALAEACLTIAQKLLADPSLSGTYHFAGAPDVSWADFARAIFAESGDSIEIVDIPTSDFPTPAKRPLNSRLDCSDLSRFGLSRPDWRPAVRQIVQAREEV